MLSDIDNSTLHSGPSSRVGIPYLDEAAKGEADRVPGEINGVLYGPKTARYFHVFSVSKIRLVGRSLSLCLSYETVIGVYRGGGFADGEQ